MKQTLRFAGLDLIRALAIFSVIGGHFFMNTGFQNVEFGGGDVRAQVHKMTEKINLYEYHY